MDENLRQLLHEELEGLFDGPSRPAGSPSGASASDSRPDAGPGTGNPQNPPSSTALDDLMSRLSRPDVLAALARLLGVR